MHRGSGLQRGGLRPLGSLWRKSRPKSGGSGTEEDCTCHRNHLSKGLQLHSDLFLLCYEIKDLHVAGYTVKYTVWALL